MPLTPAEVGGSESGQVRGGTPVLCPDSAPGHLPQSGPQSKETQAEGEGHGVWSPRCGAVNPCVCACMHSLSLCLTHKHTPTHTTQTQACTHTHVEVGFRRWVRGGGQGKLSLWLMTQSLWNSPSAFGRGRALPPLPSHQPLQLLRLEQ